MAAQIGNLQVRIGADITGLQTGMTRAQRQVATGARGMQKSVSDLQLTFKEVATTAGRSLRVLGGAFAIGIGVREIANIADAAKNLTAQLKLATSQYGSFGQAQKDVQNIAQVTRSDLLATGELYSALQRNSDQFGASQEQVARITQTVSEAFKISGASADEASNATRQLVQAFQSGRLQGDEFRSVMENAPRLARALADSLGVTIGQLRTMSKEGTLTAAALVKAFSDQKVTAGIDAEFKQLPVTFDQAMGQVYNAAVVTFGAFDSGGQFSNEIANFVTGGTQGFADLQNAAYEFGAEFRAIIDVGDAVRDAFASLQTEGISGLLGLKGATLDLQDALKGVLGVVDGVANAFANLVNLPGNLIRTVTGYGGKPIVDPVNMRGVFTGSLQKAHLRRIAGNGLDPAEWPGRRPPALHPAAVGGTKGGGRAKRAPEDRSAETEAQFDKDMRQADMEILRARQDLLHNSAQRASVEIQLLELDRQSENDAIEEKVRRAQKDLADKRITKAAFDKVQADANILKEKNDEVSRLKIQGVLDDLAHQRAEDMAKLADTDFELQRDALQSQEDIATTAAERRAIELRLLDLSYRQEKAKLEAVLLDEQASDAAKEEARRRLGGLNAGYAAKQAGVMQSTAGPLEQWAKSVPQTAAQINEALQSIEVKGLDGISDAIADVITGTKSLKDAFGDMAKQILSDIIQMTIRMLIMQAIMSIIRAMVGGAPGFAGGGSIEVPTMPSLPGFAAGGSFGIGGFAGIDKNMLSLNGIPFARVSHGETINIIPENERNGRSGGGGAVTIHQHYSFSGVAVTKDEFVSGLMFAKHDTIATLRDMNRRGR